MAAMALQSCVSLKLPFQFAFCSPNLHSLLWWLITPDVLQNVVAHVWFVCWSVAKFQGNWTQPWQCGQRLGHGTQASTQSRHSVFSLRQLANRHLVRREMQRYEWLSKDFLTFFRKFSAVNFCLKSGFDLLHFPISMNVLILRLNADLWVSLALLTFFRKFSAVNFCLKSGFDLLHYPSPRMYWF